MSRYDWLLFLHVLAAFSLVAAMVVFWAVVAATARGRAAAPFVPSLLLPANILVVVGTLGTVAFGVWLAVDVEGYKIWDGWILASLVLWAASSETGRRSGDEFQRSMATGDPGASALARRRGLVLHSTSSLVVLAILVLMMFKPGA